MPAEGGGKDDDRHRREEADRRAKRKASKHTRTSEQLEKERQRKKYRQEILQKTGAATATTSSSSRHARPLPPGKKNDATAAAAAVTGSAFQDMLFGGTRGSQGGFQIEFRFRNAPPRPPVGPCFVGETIDAVLLGASKKYKPFNSVEVHHVWKLHTENDIGVPLAPSAMDVNSYKDIVTNSHIGMNKLHPADDAILNWAGSMGDSAAEELKRRQEQSRASARLALSGRILNTNSINNSATSSAGQANNKMIVPTNAATKKQKATQQFSRVLNEGMQTWMKKTTYLSNDYSRKVHDFKSLAKTKSDLSEDLQKKQREMAIRRTARWIENSFTLVERDSSNKSTLQHPTNPKLKPKAVLSILPDVSNWGRAYTHVVIDKAPITLPTGQAPSSFHNAFVTNVERTTVQTLSCHVIVPAASERIELLDEQQQQQLVKEKEGDDNGNDKEIKEDASSKKKAKDENYYESAQKYDLEVAPLRDDEDSPHSTYSFCLDPVSKTVRYIPLASRVSLSTGRPSSKSKHVYHVRAIQRRSMTNTELTTMEERVAELDVDMAEKHHIHVNTGNNTHAGSSFMMASLNKNNTKKRSINDDDDEDDDDGLNDNDVAGDDDDDDDDDEEVFGGGTKTIVAD